MSWIKTTSGSGSLPIPVPKSLSQVNTYVDGIVSSAQGFFYPVAGLYDIRNLNLTSGTATLTFTPVYSSSPTKPVSISQVYMYSCNSGSLYPTQSGTAYINGTVSPSSIASGTSVTLTASLSSTMISSGFIYFVFRMNPNSGDTGTQYQILFQNMVLTINGVEVPKDRLIGATPHTAYTTTINTARVDRTLQQTNSVLQSRWAGKKICFLGDSITATTNDNIGPRYPQIVPTILGTSYDEDRSLSGMSVGVGSNNNTLTSKMYMHHNFDLITIALGYNDYSFGVPLGTLGARSEAITAHDKTTFYGAYRFCLDSIFTENPNATVVLLTPIYSANEDTANATTGLYLKDYRSAIHTIGDFYNIRVFDTNFGTNYINYQSILTDGSIHQGHLGHWKMAEALGSYLASI